jgi:hypothetical protein
MSMVAPLVCGERPEARKATTSATSAAVGDLADRQGGGESCDVGLFGDLRRDPPGRDGVREDPPVGVLSLFMGRVVSS